MEKSKKTVSLVAKIIVGVTFLGVFFLNALMFVQTDGNSFSIESLKAYAQTGGTNNEEEEGSRQYEDISVVNQTNVWPCEGYIPGEPEDIIYDGLVTETCTGRYCFGNGTVSCTPVQITCVSGDCIGI